VVSRVANNNHLPSGHHKATVHRPQKGSKADLVEPRITRTDIQLVAGMLVSSLSVHVFRASNQTLDTTRAIPFSALQPLLPPSKTEEDAASLSDPPSSKQPLETNGHINDPQSPEGKKDLALAREVTTDLFLHYQYVRTILYPIVNHNPFGACHPRQYGDGKNKRPGGIIAELSFQDYVKGLVTMLQDGDEKDKVHFLLPLYARAWEGMVTWEEAETLLKTHATDTPEVHLSIELLLFLPSE